ncbi:hypothetical protein ONZ45_g10068 [Pleurotus djamor]|nr:hypothetical protein ONZ45_g10068 [Pleurotus djamor]
MSPPSAHPFGIHSMMNSLPPQALGPLDVLPHAQEHMQHDPTINTASASSSSSEYDLGANDHSSSSYGALSSASSTQPLPEVHPMGAWYPPTSIQANNTVAAASNTWAHDVSPSEVVPYDASHSQMNLPVEAGGMGAGVDGYDPGLTYDTSYEVEAPSFGAEAEANVYAHPQASLYQHPAHPLVDQTQGCGVPMGSLATYDGAIFADQVHAQGFEQWDASAAQTQTWA